jgi:hypothetical protein
VATAFLSHGGVHDNRPPRRSQLSRHPRTQYAVPAETARAARACFPHGHPYLRLYDELGTLFCDHDFADLFPARGQPAAMSTDRLYGFGPSNLQNSWGSWPVLVNRGGLEVLPRVPVP